MRMQVNNIYSVPQYTSFVNFTHPMHGFKIIIDNYLEYQSSLRNLLKFQQSLYLLANSC